MDAPVPPIPSPEAARGKVLLGRGVIVYSLAAAVPVALMVAAATGPPGFLLALPAVVILLMGLNEQWDRTPEERASRARRPMISLWLIIAFGVSGFYTLFISGALLASPWATLRGSNGARTLAGIVALLGAMVCVPTAFAIASEDGRLIGIAALLLFPMFCFLVNVFLLNKDVRAWVSCLRAERGLSPDHWRIGDS